MRSTTTFSRGNVVLVPYPFSDRNEFKNRPALVISSDRFHRGRNDVVIAAITSRIRDPLLQDDCLVQHWRAAGLLRPSIVTGIIRTTKNQLIVRVLGQLAESDLELVDSELLANLLPA